MKSKKYYATVVAAVALAAILGWWLQRPKVAQTAAGATPAGQQSASGKSDNSPPSVEAIDVKTSRLVDDAQAVGTLVSHQSVMLRPEVSGRVVQLDFADGAAVRRGQVLVRLDDVLQQAELSQAQAQLSMARANHKRNQELVAQNFVAQRVLDESRAALQVAEAQVQLAQARLARMRLVAPFDGTVGIRNVHLGDYVKDGADLVRLEDTSVLYVDFRLPERYQSRLGKGQAVTVALDALPGKAYTAKVLAIDPLVDADGRALLVRAVLPAGAGSVLRPGMFARVNVVFAVNEAAVMVPEEAVVPVAGKQMLYRLQPAADPAQPPVAKQVEVSLGLRHDGKVQVLQGIAPGERIVVAGQQRLRKDGMPVRVVNLPAAAEGTR
ncbi:MAG TPA: efflux RND transporter periplasmic adaptor subunit [Macromonas sp.]|nr:efflux RND transporter periplasmic adaptor subunit [Macromonas sp.]